MQAALALLLSSAVAGPGAAAYDPLPANARATLTAGWRRAVAEQSKAVAAAAAPEREEARRRLEELKRNDPPWVPEFARPEPGDVGRIPPARVVERLDNGDLVIEFDPPEGGGTRGPLRRGGRRGPEVTPGVVRAAIRSQDAGGESEPADGASGPAAAEPPEDAGPVAGTESTEPPEDADAGESETFESGEIWQVTGVESLTTAAGPERLPVLEPFDWPGREGPATAVPGSAAVDAGGPAPPKGIRVARLTLRGPEAQLPGYLAAVAAIYPGAESRALRAGEGGMAVEIWGSRVYMNDALLAATARRHGLEIVNLVRYRAQ